MSLLFISHASKDNTQALALHDWLAAKGWDNIFLDVSQERGLTVGQAWRDELNQHIKRCDAMLLLISKNWLASRECLKELTIAIHENKIIYGLLIEDIPVEELDDEIRAQQLVNLCDIQDYPITVSMPTGDSETVHFSEQALERFYKGLEAKGLTPEGFVWPPLDEPDRKPYRGLEPLQAEDAGIFFGRDADTQKLLSELETLRGEQPPRFLSILGASGAGKSSFMRASILPRLARRPSLYASLPIIRPESAVLTGQHGLHNALSKAFKQYGTILTTSEIISALQDNPMALFAELAQLARLPQTEALPTLIIAIDQAEELFNSEGKAESHDFLTLLNDIIRQNSVPIMVLCTIRSNAFELLQTTTLLTGVQQQTYSLQPIAKGAYQQIIEGPVKLLKNSPNALTIDPNLTQALLDDIDKGTSKDALPLLAFTLEQLYLEQLHNDDDKRTLTLSEYETMGKIEGAIEKTVQKALTDAKQDPNVPNDDDQCLALLKQGLIPWLAGIDKETREPKRKVAKLSDIPEVSRPLMKYFIDNRLLSVSRIKDTEGNEIDTIEPAHESVLRQWGKLKGWLDDDFVALTTHDALKSATLDWKINKRDKQWLNHKQGRLTDAEELLKNPRFADAIEPEQRDYLKACRQKERSSQRLLITGFFFALILAGVASLFAYRSYENEQLARAETVRANQQSEIADKKTAEAEKSKAAAEAETQKTQEALIEANHNYALALNEKAIQAEQEGNIEYAKLYALHALKNINYNHLKNQFLSLGVLFKHGVRSRHIWTSNFTFLHEKDLKWIRYFLNASTLITGGGGEINFWNLQTGDIVKTLKPSWSTSNFRVAFSKDARLLAISDNNEIFIWDIETLTLRGKLTNEEFSKKNFIYKIKFLDNDNKLCAFILKKNITCWNVDDLKKANIEQSKLVDSFHVFDLTNDLVFSAIKTSEKNVDIWHKNNKILSFTKEKELIKEVKFSDTGNYLVILTVSEDEHKAYVLKLDLPKPKLVFSTVGTEASFSADGNFFAVKKNIGEFGGLFIHDVKNNWKKSNVYYFKEKIDQFSFSNDEKQIALLSSSDHLYLWDLGSSKLLNPNFGHSQKINTVAVSRNHDLLITGGADGFINFRKLSTGKLVKKIMPRGSEEIINLKLSDDAKSLLVELKYGMILLINVKNFSVVSIVKEKNVKGADFSSDGRKIAYGVGSKVKIIDTQKHNENIELEGSGSQIKKVVFSRDENSVISVSDKNEVLYWDVKNSSFTQIEIEGNPPITDILLNSKNIIITSRKKIFVWSIENEKIINELESPESDILSIDVSAESWVLATGHRNGDVLIWNLLSESIQEKLSKNNGPVNDVRFSSQPNSDYSPYLISVSNEITIWDVTNIESSAIGFFLEASESDESGNFQLFNDISVFTNKSNSKVILMDVETRSFYDILEIDSSYLRCFEQQRLCTVLDEQFEKIQIFDVENKRILHEKNINIKKINNKNKEQQIPICLFYNEDKIAFLDTDNNIQILHYKKEQTFKKITNKSTDASSTAYLLLSQDDKYILLWQGSEIQVWDTQTSERVWSDKLKSDGTKSAMFLPRNKLVLIQGKNLYIQDLKSSKKIIHKLDEEISRWNSKLHYNRNDDSFFVIFDNGILLVFGENYEKTHFIKLLIDSKDGDLMSNARFYGITYVEEINHSYLKLQQTASDNISQLLSKKNLEAVIQSYEQKAKISLQENLNIKDQTHKLNLFHKQVEEPVFHRDHILYWLPMANEGDDAAMLRVGNLYYREGNIDKAREWYQKALDAGNPDAEERLRILALTKQSEEASAQDVQ